MKTLTEKELLKVDGGFKWGVVGIIAGAVVLIVGVFDGFTNPLKCNK